MGSIDQWATFPCLSIRSEYSLFLLLISNAVWMFSRTLSVLACISRPRQHEISVQRQQLLERSLEFPLALLWAIGLQRAGPALQVTRHGDALVLFHHVQKPLRLAQTDLSAV